VLLAIAQQINWFFLCNNVIFYVTYTSCDVFLFSEADLRLLLYNLVNQISSQFFCNHSIYMRETSFFRLSCRFSRWKSYTR